jgi:hypothetical protein
MYKDKEFYQHRVIIPKNRRHKSNECVLFDQISHITHLHLSYQILENQIIRAGLVYDKSKLNKDRILVTWLSPNYWYYGFRYGNVSFNYDFSNLIAGKRFYWVEIVNHSIAACRILITENNYDNLFEPYDPKIAYGPWWYDEQRKEHYRNNNICLEFLFESDLNISDIIELKFVDHHSKYCCIKKGKCKDLSLNSSKASTYFLAKFLSNDFAINHNWFNEIKNNQTRLKSDMMDAYDYLIMRLANNVHLIGSIDSKNKSAMPLLKAILNNYSMRQDEDYKQLLTLFLNKREFIETLKELALEKLDLTLIESEI